MAPEKSQDFIAEVETENIQRRLPYTHWKLTSGSQYKESIDLKPKWNLSKHSQSFEFSLKPPMPGTNRAENPDYFKWSMENAPSTMKPFKYHEEWRGNVGGTDEGLNKAKNDWFRSSLDIKLQKKYLKIESIGLDDASSYRRGLLVENV